MTELASKAVATIDDLSVDDNTAAHTCAECNDDEVLHATCCAIGHLTHCCGVGVVGELHGNACCLVEHIGQRNDALVSPRQVGSELDGAVVVVAVGSTDAHALHLVGSANLCQKGLQASHASLYEGFSGLVLLRLDTVLCNDLATSVNDSEYGVGTTQVHTNHIGFHFVHCFSLVLNVYIFNVYKQVLVAKEN